MLNSNNEIKNTIFALAGPTASGKTNLSLIIAEKYNAEIISVDSALIYRSMDIGTAKPSKEAQNKVPHHLIDIIDPSETYSVAQFIEDATHCTQNILSRGKTPLFVGGTMLYYKALIEGLSDLPPSNPSIRKQLMQKDTQTLFQNLQKKDPKSSERLASTDRQRILRALEITLSTQKPFSQILQEQPLQKKYPYPIQMIGLMPSNRKQLHQRIASRFEQMLNNGFLAEIEALYQRHDLSKDMPALRAVGYRQAWQYFHHEIDYPTFVERAIISTRQLAKRQFTWLNNWSTSDMIKIDPDEHNFDFEILAHKLKKIMGETPW